MEYFHKIMNAIKKVVTFVVTLLYRVFDPTTPAVLRQMNVGGVA